MLPVALKRLWSTSTSSETSNKLKKAYESLEELKRCKEEEPLSGRIIKLITIFREAENNLKGAE